MRVSRPPPSLYPNEARHKNGKKSITGTVIEAISLQEQNAVPERLRGLWFHSSKEKKKELTEHGDPTFFSRSPLGWTGWGGDKAADPVLVVCVVQPFASADSLTRAPFVAGGDKGGFENGQLLPDWWLIVQNEDIDKLMIVDVFNQNDKVAIKVYTDQQEYNALRARAVDGLAKKKA
jgi:hypothetical protein